ncbi:unnamed protein product, partial [Notodromas monacha]
MRGYKDDAIKRRRGGTSYFSRVISLSINLQRQVEELESRQDEVQRLSSSAATLLSSHLDSYIQSQLRHLQSRYQVQVNLAKDTSQKVTAIYQHHKQMEDNRAAGMTWIDAAKAVIRDGEGLSSSSRKEDLLQHLQDIQKMIKNQDEGASLVHAAVNWGEKAIMSTRSDGKDAISIRCSELQSEWERLIRKLSDAKVQVETALLQWADYTSSFSQLEKWISEKETTLEKLSKKKVHFAKKGPQTTHGLGSLSSSIGERRASLRRCNSFLQDIASFAPMIESVACKASDVKSGKNAASEISSKYETLSQQAQKIYERQKETIEFEQKFIDAANNFLNWLKISREKLTKCAEPIGDKESLSTKIALLKVLDVDKADGQKLLELPLRLAEGAIKVIEVEDDREALEQEVAILQDEFDHHCAELAKTKTVLEIGLSKWGEYEDQHKECCSWLTKTEAQVQSYNGHVDTLEEKRKVLEEFQNHLESIFDWQKELDVLNNQAQTLLETCADSRISNAVTQLTTKYNTLLSMAKEVMRRLEMHYQEHQQHQAMFSECEEWLEAAQDKLKSAQTPPASETDVLISDSDLQDRLGILQELKDSMEQGQHKLRYVLELKERVIINTKEKGANKIIEGTEGLKTEFDKLFMDMQEARQNINSRLGQLQEKAKVVKAFMEWLQEIEAKANAEPSSKSSEISERRSFLEKYRTLKREMEGRADALSKIIAMRSDDGKDSADEELKACVQKHDDIKSVINSQIEVLEGEVKNHEAYWAACSEACDWLRKARVDIQQAGDCHGPKASAEERKEKVNEISVSLPEGEKLVKAAAERSAPVMMSSNDEGVESIKSEVEHLKHEWDSIYNMVDDAKRNLSKCLQAWSDFDKSYSACEGWLKTLRSDLEKAGLGFVTLDEPLPRPAHHDIVCKAKEFLEEIQLKKGTVEELSDKCEILMEYSAQNYVRDQTVQLQGQFTQLLSKLQSQVSKAEKQLSDVNEYNRSKQDMEKWLDRAKGTVDDCSSCVGSEADVQDRLETLRILSTKLTEGQYLLNNVLETLNRASMAASPQSEALMKQEVEELRS